MVKLKAFSKFENTTEALAGAAALTDSKLSKGLKKFLKKNAAADELAVLDAKLGGLIKEKLGIQCIWRCARRRAMPPGRCRSLRRYNTLEGAVVTPFAQGYCSRVAVVWTLWHGIMSRAKHLQHACSMRTVDRSRRARTESVHLDAQSAGTVRTSPVMKRYCLLADHSAHTLQQRRDGAGPRRAVAAAGAGQRPGRRRSHAHVPGPQPQPQPVQAEVQPRQGAVGKRALNIAVPLHTGHHRSSWRLTAVADLDRRCIPVVPVLQRFKCGVAALISLLSNPV